MKYVILAASLFFACSNPIKQQEEQPGNNRHLIINFSCITPTDSINVIVTDTNRSYLTYKFNYNDTVSISWYSGGISYINIANIRLLRIPGSVVDSVGIGSYLINYQVDKNPPGPFLY